MLGFVAWTITVGILAMTVYYRQQNTAREFAYLEAVASFEKDILYRRWAASHGGVYVPATAATPPNPYLAHVPDRDISVQRGRSLTLVNPAYMMRQVHELGKEHYRAQGHITSLNPLRPQNAPDSWEAEALKAVEKGMREVVSVERVGGEPQLRLMRPLLVEERCMKCHAHQGYRIGDVRGGISTSVPLRPFLAMMVKDTYYSIIGLGFLWLLGIAGLVLSGKSLTRYFEERQRAETALREREEQVRVLFEHAPEAIVVYDVDLGRIIDANANAAELCGCSREELMSTGYGVFYAHEQPDNLSIEKSMEDHIRRALAGEVVVFPRHLRNSAGNDILCEVHLLRLPSSQRRLLRASYIDITERKRLEEETMRLHKLEAVGILAGGLAHDFNNVLTAAIGNLELAKMKTTPDEKSYGYLMQIEKILEQARELGNRLLVFSKGGDPIKKPVEMAPLLKASLAWVLDGTRIAYDLKCSGEHIVADCDEEQVHQVFRNLLVNAKEALPGGGLVSVACEMVSVGGESALSLPPGDYVMIAISDNGVGIAEENLGRIFDPYFTTKDKYSQKGIGLGLSICHAIIKKHGGFITVESQPDIGTTFHVYLPAARNNA